MFQTQDARPAAWASIWHQTTRSGTCRQVCVKKAAKSTPRCQGSTL